MERFGKKIVAPEAGEINVEERRLALQLPTIESKLAFEKEIAQFLARKGLGLNKIKLLFPWKSKEEVRKLIR